MPRSRLIQRIAGDPEKVASRLAVRLRYLGDQIQVVSATEFIHAPQPAERLLFCCPRHVRVVVLPADEPGHCLLVLEPRHESWWRWRWPARLATAACTALAAWLLRDGPFLALLGTLCPLLTAALAPVLLHSGWTERLLVSAQTGATPGLDRVPAAARWLTLSPAEREAVVAEVAAAAEALRTSEPQWSGIDDRSAEERLGWPLRHRASGADPVTGRPRHARGWLAIGQYARGRIAVGQVAAGWLAIGQAACGLLVVAQVGAGVLVVAQVALAALVALGQLAAGLLAAGQIAVGAVAAGLMTEVVDLLFWVLVPAFALAGFLAARLARQPAADQVARVEQQLAERGEAPLPDEASLSLTGRMTADPERGLSPAEVELRDGR